MASGERMVLQNQVFSDRVLGNGTEFESVAFGQVNSQDAVVDVTIVVC